MKIFTTLWIALAIVVTISAALYSQGTITPAIAKARVFGVSPNMILDNVPGIDRPSNGLPNVAKNTKVYIYCGGKPSTSTVATATAANFSSATFNIYEKPAGSAAAISTIDSLRVSFIPDVEGTYRIEMSAIDDKGRTGGDTLVVNVAKYVGVGGLVGGTASVPECSTPFCHGDQAAANLNKASGWAKTAHATALIRKLDDTSSTSSFRQAACMPCHTTGSTDPLAEGDGFLARAKALGWVFPSAIGPGTWDALKTNYPDLAKLGNIQCENCHGPGSAHMGNKTDNKIFKTVTSQQCRQCHDSPPYVKVSEWEISLHGNSYNQGSQQEYQNRKPTGTDRNSDCARCHTSNGYIDVFYKSADPSTALTKAPYKDVGYVSCATCHDPHNGDNAHQLRKDINLICADCHSVRISSRGLHSSHQGPMLNGQDGVEFPGYVYENSSHTNVADKCATCHMSPPPDPKYQNLLGGHTFRVVYDNGTPSDISDDVVNTTGCISCHASGVTMADIEGRQDETKALLDSLKKLLPLQANGTPKTHVDTTLTPLQQDCAYNYYFVLNDGSFGVHNFKYAKGLIESSIAQLKALGVESVDATPGSFRLGQNYPNPFNPSTTFEFSIPAASDVRIAVYDASGKQVNVLVNGYYQAGSYRVGWNGTTVDTKPVPSGMYYYTITAKGNTATRKMILMK